MSEQFSRTELLFGSEAMERLFAARVAVFGVGGVGGNCVEALARSGIGMLALFDSDKVCLSNINRQVVATHKTLGEYKVDAMRARILDINPNASVEVHKIFYLPENAESIDLSAYDYIVDAIDTMTAKLELVCRAKALNVPIISSMGAANRLDPTAFRVADIYQTSACPVARIMRRELRKRGVESLKVVYSTEESVKIAHDGTEQRPVPASNAFVPPAAGLILAAEVVKDLM